MDNTKRNPIMKFFVCSHLNTPQASVSREFCELAERMHAELPDNAEKSAALRKLLEAKDCAVRATLP
jgi:ferritin-like protein